MLPPCYILGESFSLLSTGLEHKVWHTKQLGQNRGISERFPLKKIFRVKEYYYHQYERHFKIKYCNCFTLYNLADRILMCYVVNELVTILNCPETEAKFLPV